MSKQHERVIPFTCIKIKNSQQYIKEDLEIGTTENICYSDEIIKTITYIQRDKEDNEPIFLLNIQKTKDIDNLINEILEVINKTKTMFYTYNIQISKENIEIVKNLI